MVISHHCSQLANPANSSPCNTIATTAAAAAAAAAATTTTTTTTTNNNDSNNNKKITLPPPTLQDISPPCKCRPPCAGPGTAPAVCRAPPSAQSACTPQH